jgi:hypothetical protein
MHVSHLHQRLGPTACAKGQPLASLGHALRAGCVQGHCIDFQLLYPLVLGVPMGRERFTENTQYTVARTMPGTSESNVRECASNLYLLAHKIWVEGIGASFSPLLVLRPELCMHSRRAMSLAKTKYQNIRAMRDCLVSPRTVAGVRPKRAKLRVQIQRTQVDIRSLL